MRLGDLKLPGDQMLRKVGEGKTYLDKYVFKV